MPFHSDFVCIWYYTSKMSELHNYVFKNVYKQLIEDNTKFNFSFCSLINAPVLYWISFQFHAHYRR